MKGPMRLLLLWLVLGLTGCATGSLSLRADRDSYRAGEEVALTLKNGTGNPAAYNLCTTTLVMAPSAPIEEDRMCTMELRVLPAGETVTEPHPLPATLTPGTYRFTTRVQSQDTMVDVSSQDFTVAK